MPIGPGKYDDYCQEILMKTKARGVILIVVGGRRGDGFSAQLTKSDAIAVTKAFSEISEVMKKDIEAL